MAVYHRNSIRICYRHLVRLDSHKLPILLMALVDGEVPSSSAALIHIPEIAEFRQKRTRNILNRPIANIWEKVEK